MATMGRMLFQAILWAVCCIGIAALLHVTLTWQVLVLVVTMSSVSDVIEWVDREMSQ